MKKTLALLLVLLMLVSLVACGGETIVWDDIILSNMIPEPPANKGEIHANSADEIWIDINDISDKQFNDYVDACKEMGFTIDGEYDSFSYEAYNAEGYKLSLNHYGSDAEMGIELEAPMEMATINWPAGTAGKQLPIPKSTIGKFSYEYDDNFFVYVGDTTRSDYAEYVTACSENGFNVDYSKGDDYYYADNSTGWHLSIRYEGNNIMSISIDAPSEVDDSDDTGTPATKPSTEPSAETTEASTEEVTEVETVVTTVAPTEANAVAGLRSDFKEAMDSYEAFMDEYVAFMKKYKENPNDLGLLMEYATFMADYAEFVEDFDKWNNEDMNDAELAYYLEVQTRVNKKLLEIA